MQTIHVTDDLDVQVLPPGQMSEHAAVVIINSGVEESEGDQRLIVHPQEIRHLIGALSEAAGMIVEAEWDG